MDRNFYNKSLKAHANILKCIEEAYRKGDMYLLMENFQRLNGLVIHYLKEADKMDIKVNILESDNKYLRQENTDLRDEVYLMISESKGRYKEAKKQLDEFYNEK